MFVFKKIDMLLVNDIFVLHKVLTKYMIIQYYFLLITNFNIVS